MRRHRRSAGIQRRARLQWAWGNDSDGQLGDGASCGYYDYFRYKPVAVRGLSGIVSVSAGGNDSAAIGKGGRVWTWGDNFSDQLGNGSSCDQIGTEMNCVSDRPVEVKDLSHVTAVAVSRNPYGWGHMLALRGSDHSLWPWGDNTGHELGDSQVPGQSSTPVRVSGLQDETVYLSAGSQFSLVVRSPTL